MFRRSRFADVIDAQLDLFLREHARRDRGRRRRGSSAYNAAERDEAEELYGDYVDAVETGTEILADLRDHYAQTLDDAEPSTCASSTAPSRSGLPEYALEIENRLNGRSGSRTTRSLGDLQTAALVGRSGLGRLALLPAVRLRLVLRRAARRAATRPLAARARRGGPATARRYRDDTLILESEWQTADRPRARDRLHAAARDDARHRAHRRGARGPRRDAHRARRSASTTARSSRGSGGSTTRRCSRSAARTALMLRTPVDLEPRRHDARRATSPCARASASRSC